MLTYERRSRCRRRRRSSEYLAAELSDEMQYRVLACVRARRDRESILRASAGRVQFFEHLDEARRHLTESHVAGMILGLEPGELTTLSAIIHAARERPVHVPLLFRLALGPGTARPLATIVQLPRVGISLAGFDDIEPAVEAMCRDEVEESARCLIINRLLRSAPAPVWDVLSAVAIVGERRVSVMELAAYCNASPRRIGERLAVAGMPPAKQLLMWTLLLHTQWRVAILGWPPKRAARAAGFPSTEALSRRIQRTTGARPGSLFRHLGFEETLELFVALIQRAPAKTPVRRLHSACFGG